MRKQETILIADDAEINRAILRSLFEGKYNLLEAENGEQALMLLRQYSETVTVVLLDLVMPVKDGYQVLEEIQQENLAYHVPVIVITADDSTDSKVRVFERGASDIITKPFDPDVVKSRVRNIIELSRYRRGLEVLVEEQSARAREANAAIIDMLSSVIESRSLESGQHIRRIRMFTKILLEEVATNYQEYGLNERQIQMITDASSMHDIGKIAIPDSILYKPGKLTTEEFEVMKTHTIRGCEILSGLDRLQDQDYLRYAYNICRHHHERWDGNGYPDGLKGNSIPICAQVVAIADCYDALTTDRVYKSAILPNQAFNMILNGECGVFSPRLLECFKNVRDSFSRLSGVYADGLPTEPIKAKSTDLTSPPVWEMSESSLEQGQLKYFTLLRYVNATVMEVDFNTGVYHLVYLADQDFSILRSGKSFESSIAGFIASVVHPEDRKTVAHLQNGIKELFEEGLMRRDLAFRMLERHTNTYVSCRVSVLRIYIENPRRQKVLLVWEKSSKTQALLKEPNLEKSGIPPIALEKLLGSAQKCRCDMHFTLLQIDRSFTELVGYSAEEIKNNFQNRYMNFVYPADREKVFEQFCEQRDTGSVMEMEYRLLTKDGRIIWVSDRAMLTMENGEEVIYCVLLDITRFRQTEDELRLSLERHDVIMSQTNDIIFEWDIHKDKLYFSTNWEAQYGYAPITENVRTRIPEASHIHPDDIPAFIELMDAMSAGVPYKETEFRIADSEGKYRWRKARSTAQFDTDGHPFKVVGVMVDIDSIKQASAELENRAARDVLTGLYNKAFAQDRIENYLLNCAPENVSAMMMLDVDNFKQINDHYGHMFGDAVLIEVSDKIAELFRVEDTVARIGGDEFLIFMADVHKVETAEIRAEEILIALRELLQETLNEQVFSVSIGLAFSSGTTIGFQDLFNQADRALYRAKAAGKNQYAVFNSEMEIGPIGALASPREITRTQIDSDQSDQWNLPDLITQSFNILYDAADFDQAICSILKLIGETFGVSRTYIFENSADGNACNNTFEWCSSGVQPQKGMLQNFPYEIEGKDYRANFDENGIFYCQDTEKLSGWEQVLFKEQDILSTLQCAIRENGAFLGFVGFDDCKVRRLWSREQIDALTFVGRLLTVFLLKNHAQDALSNSLSNLHGVLDHQDVWLYVLDPKSYRLRYVNWKTKKQVPGADPGKLCYDVFYNRSTPCENCVLQSALQTGKTAQECFNPILNLWVLADAAMVKWDKEEACLVACRDISAYKEKTE